MKEGSFFLLFFERCMLAICPLILFHTASYPNVRHAKSVELVVVVVTGYAVYIHTFIHSIIHVYRYRIGSRFLGM